jgi:hypothetical protein
MIVFQEDIMTEVVDELELLALENLDLKVANLSLQVDLLKKQREEMEKKLVEKYQLSSEDRIDPKTRQVHRGPMPQLSETI